MIGGVTDTEKDVTTLGIREFREAVENDHGMIKKKQLEQEEWDIIKGMDDLEASMTQTMTPPQSGSRNAAQTIDISSDVPQPNSQEQTQPDYLGHSALGFTAAGSSADLNDSIYRRRGPLAAAIDTLVKQLHELYEDALAKTGADTATSVLEEVLAAASTFARVHLTPYIRHDSSANVHDLEKYTRLHMGILWQGNFKLKFVLGWHDELFIQKLLQSFILVAGDCDLK